MLSDQKLLKRDYERLQFLRWVLFLVTACEAAGIKDLTRARLHALLFMSFASARYYGLKPLRQRAQRTPHGPYYRAAHLALGHLAFSGLIDVADFKAHPSPKDLQFEGTFRLTKSGLKVCQDLRQTNTGEIIYKFLLDMCLGTARVILGESEELSTQDNGTLDEMLAQDLTYVNALKRPGNSLLIEESPEEITPTVKGLNSIQQLLSQKTFVNRKDVLSAYQTLLRNRAKAA
ncbi:hypothetical protein TUM18999_02840 [Pseudomonas tohonis]|uniref:Uncharacterized protein n=1 Tax=Pseudomonas tohonis TaxID=2725477 RepID=A0A6J4DX20_9PSED|nr:hypothetical protein [Pseudomonas tohonis]BCG22093.1 hypothetical protein TUM18999_02840 [Pseudomonas tohonis]